MGEHADDTAPYADIEGTDDQLLLDVYLPNSTRPTYPAAVLIHGGGWHGGCRKWMDGLAYNLTFYGFIVFNIDYRLTCDDAGVYLCGYYFPAPVDDTLTAVSWVRDHVGDYVDFNGKVATLGTSGGGNLAFMAGATGVDDDSRPDAMAGASGYPELGKVNVIQGGDYQAMCDQIGNQEGIDTCWDDNITYMQSELDEGDWCLGGTPDNWSDASPICQVDGNAPPAFIINGTNEVSPLVGADDFLAHLTIDLSLSAEYCAVPANNGHRHGTQLLEPGIYCDGDSAPDPDAVHKVFAWLLDQTT